MTLKEKVSVFLEENRGKYISGEEIAAALGVTRSSVWKAVKALEKDGCDIEASPNKGYRLSENGDILTADTVRKYLGTDTECTLDIRRTVTSTNTLLKEAAAKGAPEGTVIIAAEQTEGRGRFNRKFVSPVSGLYMSILLRPSIPAEKALMITTAAAVAAARAIESVSGRKADIKWVNDIYCGGKKVCGILTEASFGLEGGGFDYAVCGIGVNVNPPENDFPDELRSIADSVFIRGGRSVPDARAKIAAEIIKGLLFIYKNDLEKGEYIKEYISRSLVIGKDVILINGSDTSEAHVLGIDTEARLEVRLSDGTVKKVSSGEISLRLKDND